MVLTANVVSRFGCSLPPVVRGLHAPKTDSSAWGSRRRHHSFLGSHAANSAPTSTARFVSFAAAATAAAGAAQLRRRWKQRGERKLRSKSAVLIACAAQSDDRGSSGNVMTKERPQKVEEELAAKEKGREKANEAKEEQEQAEEEKSIAERFEDFTRVLPWFNFAATVLEQHVARKEKRNEEEGDRFDADLLKRVSTPGGASEALESAIKRERGLDVKEGTFAIADVLDAIVETAEQGKIPAAAPLQDVGAIKGRWEVVWGGAFSPLHRLGFTKQCLWMTVSEGEDGSPPVLTVHGGLPLILFGAYTWTSVAGEIHEGEPLRPSGPKPMVLRFDRYWLDFGRTPRSDIGRIDGGLINNRISAFGAALVTPVLLELGAVKWFLDRIGFNKVFEVEVPKDDGSKVKLEASLELYLTLLARVAFPEILSTCPVLHLDEKAGLCVYEIPMLGPFADLPEWAHPGGNASVLVARRLKDDEEPSLMLP